MGLTSIMTNQSFLGFLEKHQWSSDDIVTGRTYSSCASNKGLSQWEPEVYIQYRATYFCLKGDDTKPG